MGLPTAEQARDLIQRGQSDPVWWSLNVLGVNLWPKQSEIIEAVRDHKRVSVRSSDGVGKSFTASVVALWYLYNFPPATVITTAPTFRQVESILWREIAGRVSGSLYPLGGKLTSTGLELSDKWFALGLSTDQPERFQGFHNEHVLVIVDEASGVSEEVFQAVENPLAAGDTKELLIGNPTQVNGAFYRSFQSPNYKCFHISSFDSPNFTTLGITEQDYLTGEWKAKATSLPFPALVSPSWVNEQLQEYGLGSYNYQVHVKGDFPEAGVNNLFKLSEVEAAMRRVVVPEGEKVASVDVARMGDDETVYLVRQGNKVLKVESWSHQDTQYTAGRVARYLREDKPSVTRVDVIGVGGGVADALKTEGFKVQMVNVGEPALDKEKYLNRRAELYWLLSRKFFEGTISLPENRKLSGQLCDIQYTYNQKGQLIIESKEDAKKRGSRSPDIADALMMAFIPLPVSGGHYRMAVV